MDITIRQEEQRDYPAVYNLIKAAFANMQESDHKEHLLVERLHRSGAFVPELSLIAETRDGKVIGYILLTEVEIASPEKKVLSLGLAPVAVLPEYQNRGIGSALIKEAHNRAVAAGYRSVVLLGHKDYYPRFGYKKAIDYDIHFPFDVPPEFCMVKELAPNSLNEVHGIVQYAPEFTT